MREVACVQAGLRHEDISVGITVRDYALCCLNKSGGLEERFGVVGLREMSSWS